MFVKRLFYAIFAFLLVFAPAHAQDDASVALGPKLGLLATANAHGTTLDHTRALFQGLDQVAQLSVKSMTTTAPPGSPSGGDAYILQPGSSPTGAWTGHAGKVAYWNALFQTSATNTYAAQWVYLTPFDGWRAYVSDIATVEIFRSSGPAWAPIGAVAGLDSPPAIGGTAPSTASFTYVSSPVGAPVASASTITPSGATFHVTGVGVISTINLPYGGFTGTLQLIPDGIFTTTTGGNIALSSTAVTSRVLSMTYDGTSWYPSY